MSEDLMHKKPQHVKGNGAQAGETPSLPSEVGELDAMRLQLATERATRLQAQVHMLEAQHQQASVEFERARLEAARVATEVWEKYQLGPADKFNSETRKIDRKPIEPPAEKN